VSSVVKNLNLLKTNERSMPFLQRSQSPAGESQFRTIDNAPTLPNLR